MFGIVTNNLQEGEAIPCRRTSGPGKSEERLVASRCEYSCPQLIRRSPKFVQFIGLFYLRTKSDADIMSLRDAEMEAMKIPAQDDNFSRRTTERTQAQMAAGDKIVQVSVPFGY